MDRVILTVEYLGVSCIVPVQISKVLVTTGIDTPSFSVRLIGGNSIGWRCIRELSTHIYSSLVHHLHKSVDVELVVLFVEDCFLVTINPRHRSLSLVVEDPVNYRRMVLKSSNLFSELLFRILQEIFVNHGIELTGETKIMPNQDSHFISICIKPVWHVNSSAPNPE